MPKQKTHKGLSKRVKVTATGKVRRKKAGMGHLMGSKNAKRRRQLNSPAMAKTKTAETMKVKLGCK
ncbi:MAG: 50S ribosomal protein L35 [Planctomycetota bacterium]|jgi:large subunit ribosomal protein L35